MIYDSLDYAKKNDLKHRLARHGLYEKRPQENREMNTQTERKRSGKLQRPMLVLAKSELEIGHRRSKGSSVTFGGD